MLKDNKINYEKVKEEFHSYNKNNNEYKHINKIYKEIKEYYRKEVSENKLDIRVEKIRVERAMGIYYNKGFELTTSFFIAIYASIIIIMIEKTEQFMPSNLYPIFYGSLILFLVWDFNKSNKKDKPRDIMLNISLAVLDDMEKEINQGYADAIKEAAATKNVCSGNLITRNIIKIMRLLRIS